MDQRQTAIFHEMLEAGPFCETGQVVENANRRYLRMIRWAESQVGHAEKEGALCQIFRQMSPAALWFLLRSGPVRARADNLSSLLLKDGTHNQTIIQQAYDLLREAVIRGEAADCVTPGRVGNNADYSSWESAGFDFRKVLSEPFPFIISAWAGTPDQSASWSEARELAVLFEEKIEATAGGERCALRPLSDAQCDDLERTLQVMQMISSAVVADVIGNVRHVCLIDYSRWPTMADSEYREIGLSLSNHGVPSAIFFPRLYSKIFLIW
jgi:hypothetical protein